MRLVIDKIIADDGETIIGDIVIHTEHVHVSPNPDQSGKEVTFKEWLDYMREHPELQKSSGWNEVSQFEFEYGGFTRMEVLELHIASNDELAEFRLRKDDEQ